MPLPEFRTPYPPNERMLCFLLALEAQYPSALNELALDQRITYLYGQDGHAWAQDVAFLKEAGLLVVTDAQLKLGKVRTFRATTVGVLVARGQKVVEGIDTPGVG